MHNHALYVNFQLVFLAKRMLKESLKSTQRDLRKIWTTWNRWWAVQRKATCCF